MATPHDTARFSDGLTTSPQTALRLVVEPTLGAVESASVPASTGSPRELIDEIADAVRAAGGDRSDVIDLHQVWERMQADAGGRVERMRFEASHPRCACIDGGEPDDADEGLCIRCYGARVR